MSENLLQQMLDTQKKFQDSEHLDPPIFELASALMTEGGELWAISCGKWWKHYIEDEEPRGRHYDETKDFYAERVVEANKLKVIDETIDIFHFLLAIWIKLGLSEADIYKYYNDKMQVNIQRQKNKY